MTAPAPAPMYVPGNQVLVIDERDGNWAGQVTQPGLFPTSPVEVVVLDPLERRDVTRGQRLVVVPGSLRLLRRDRWSR